MPTLLDDEIYLGGGGTAGTPRRTAARVPEAASMERQELERKKYEDYQRDVQNALAILQARVKDIRPAQGETEAGLREQILQPVLDTYRIVPGFADEGASARINQTGRREEAALKAARNVQVQAEAQRRMAAGESPPAAYSGALMMFEPDAPTINANRLATAPVRPEPEEMVSVPIPLEVQPRGVALGRQQPQTATARLPMNNPLVQKYLGSNLQTAPISSPAASAASPLPKSKDELKKGQAYQTKRGVATWDGTRFVQ